MKPRPLLPLLCLVFTFASGAKAEMNWLTWGDEAMAAATEGNRPIYLFVADPLNEFTGAMNTDTFSNREVVAFLQENYVCVRATRDELPGIAAYGQHWLSAEQKLPGWPLNLWFTPAQEPIEAASYLPPTEEWGREGFMVVAQRVAANWQDQPEAVTRAAQRRKMEIADYLPFAAEGLADLEAALDQAATDWVAKLNPETGTFGEAPHRPEPELLRFLMARGGAHREAALSALRIRLASPLVDPVDGGVFRSTVDGKGGIPVFQKRLNDQARFALACLDAAQLSDDPTFAAGAKSALDYAVNRLSPGDGTFIIGESATSDPTTLLQTWSWNELVELIGEDHAAAVGARPDGNVDPTEDLEGKHAGRNVLHIDPANLQTVAAGQAKLALQVARDAVSDNRLHLPADAAAHALMLHAMQRIGDEQVNLDHGHYLLATKAVLLRDFAAGTEFFSHLPNTEVPALPNDYLLTGFALGQPEMIAEADDAFYDDEFGLYYATRDEVLGMRPLMWPSAAGEMPAPASWRVGLPGVSEYLVTELTAAFDDPDNLPSGDVLLALQHHLSD